MSKRAPNKVMIGGYLNEGLSKGVDAWVEKNQPKDRTHFLYEAIVEKLRADGIDIPPDALRHSPARRPTKYKISRGHDLQFNERRGKS